MSDYISTTEAAEILNVSRVTIFNMIKDGRIDAIKVGRNYIIHRDRLKNGFVKDVKELILPVLKKHGVKRAAIFGSIARGKRRKKSDLDLLIEFKGNNKSLLDLVGLKLELEELLKMKVDVITYDSLHHLLKDIILNEQVVIL